MNNNDIVQKLWNLCDVWVADSEQALELALAMPWAAWRVYLHPSQAAAVAADHSGPARITEYLQCLWRSNEDHCQNAEPQY